MRISIALTRGAIIIGIMIAAGIIGGVSGYNYGLTSPAGGYRSEGWFSSIEFDRQVNSVLYSILGAVAGMLAVGFVIGLITLVLSLMRRSQDQRIGSE